MPFLKASRGHWISVALLGGTIFLLAALLAAFVVGGRVANPQDTSWMEGDFVTMQFAWDAYRSDPLPASSLMTTRVSWPLPISVAMFDIVPIVAWPLKLLSGWLPARFQYFGPLFIVNAGLQGLFALLLFWEASVMSWSTRQRLCGAAIAALLVAAAPVLYARFQFQHPPLTAQWLIVAALWLYARSGRVRIAQTLAAFAVLLFLAGGINPYLLVMTTGVYCGAIFKLVIERRMGWAGVIGAAAPIFASAGALVLFGYLDLRGPGVINGGGYGLYSSNLNSLINPLPILGSAFLPSLPTMGLEQNEGYGYLGLGTILLVTTGLLLGLAKRRVVDSFASPLLFVAAGALMLALSTTPSLGTHVVHGLTAGPLNKALETFRSSGRFIWVTHYVLVALGATMILRLAPARLALPILLLGVLVQAVDLGPAYQRIHAYYDTAKSLRFNDSVFSDLGRSHDALMVVPPWECGPAAEPGYPVDSFQPVSFLAMDNHLRTNSFYSGRLPRDQAQYHCVDFPLSFATSKPNSRAAYLFTPRGFLENGGKVQTTHLCDLADGFVLCRADRDGVGLGHRASRAFSELTVGLNVLIAPAKSEIWPRVSAGFERTDGALRMIGREANIELASHVPFDVDLGLEMTFGQDKPATLARPVEVYVNSVKVGTVSDTSAGAKALFFVPVGLQNFGQLNVSLVDLSSHPGGTSLETIEFKSVSEPGQTPTVEIEFGQQAGRSPFLLSGWSGSEAWGVWSQGEQASLYFPSPLLGFGAVTLDFKANPFLAPKSGVTSQRIIVSANGSPLGEQRLDGSTGGFRVAIPESIVRQNAQGLVLRFDLPDRNSPSGLGLSPDARELGLGLEAAVLRRAY